jgi:hypothetical protein
MQMIVSVMFLIALACCLVSTVAFRPTFFRPAHQLSLLTQVQHTRLFSTPVRPRLKRRPTWEEKYETDPLKSDSPTVDVHPPLDIFRKWFACYSSIDSPEALERRSEAWVHHMQWARRSVLGQSLRDSISADDTEVFEAIPTAKVDAAYTLLTENRMQPAGQLLILRANSTAEVQKYIQSEPLQNHGGVAPWKMFELRLAQHTIDAELEDEGESLADYFTSDVHDPLLFISMVNEPSPVGSKKAAGGAAEARKSAVQESMKYHLDAGRTVQDAPAGKTSAEAGAHFLPLYRNASRVAMLGELLSVDGDGQHSKSGKQGGGDREVLGQLLLFNAHSRADALRYLRRDPVASTGALLPLAPTGEKEEVLFDTAVSADIHVPSMRSQNDGYLGLNSITIVILMCSCHLARCLQILAAVNVQDVSGLHHLMPRSFAEKEELDQVSTFAVCIAGPQVVSALED